MKAKASITDKDEKVLIKDGIFSDIRPSNMLRVLDTKEYANNKMKLEPPHVCPYGNRLVYFYISFKIFSRNN